MEWLEISVPVDGEAAEAVAEYLRPFAYQEGVVLEQLGDPDSTDVNALQSQINVRIYVPAEEDTPKLRKRISEILYYLGRLYPIPEPTFRTLADEDWANAWKENYKPFRIGKRFWIEPSWMKGSISPGNSIVITIDPGMAFGTGLHPTTKMCIEAIEMVLKPGSDVLDIGSGSGILAIAAAKLGAKKVAAVDIDEVAVKTTAKNIDLNTVSSIVTVHCGVLNSISTRPWDLVLVNILAPVIVSLLQENNLLDYLGTEGFLVLAGIIEDQVDGVEQVVKESGGAVYHRLTEGDWITLIITKDARTI